MRTMSSRSRQSAAAVAVAALAAVLAGCGGSTVEGSAPEVSSQTAGPSAASSAPFADERPEKPTGPVPPPPSSRGPEPLPGEPRLQPEAAPAPAPAPDADAEPLRPPEPGAPAAPAPGGGDFAALLDRQGVVLPGGVDPVATATEACGRFDGGQQMDEVSGWLGEYGRLGTEQQGFFLGAAVGTYCPENFPKLG